VHKETIAVALAEAGKRSEVREYGKIANTPIAVETLAAKLARNGHELRFYYEAGPCGYGIQRQLTVLEHDCIVVAPSLIPRRPGDRIKTDRRDAVGIKRAYWRQPTTGSPDGNLDTSLAAIRRAGQAVVLQRPGCLGKSSDRVPCFSRPP
jgi:transposase